ncbi:MAG: hypothetical protein KBG28_11050 [Kofleriaceae bacterium]|nr:hypothetical protein [Kofleriaceae bacterium]
MPPALADGTRWMLLPHPASAALPAAADPRSTAAMGKVEDMRRQREAQVAAQEKAARARAVEPAVARAPALPVEPAAAPAAPEAQAPKPAPKATFGTRRPRADADGETGTCASCGKVRPLQGGVIGSHQKGLGKMCPGSRKPPA